VNVIETYINQFEEPTRLQLIRLHSLLKSILPEAEECLNYQMPCFRQKKNIVYFAGYKNHIGFYPSAEPITKYKNLLSRYRHSKGAIQFPIHEPLPYELIQTLVSFRLERINS